jgi:adenine phosphoribosyltransferase
MSDLTTRIKEIIVDVPDYPKPGILFKDVSTVFENPILSNDIVNVMAGMYTSDKPDAIAGLESRGFVLGMPLAMRLGVPFILIRKKNKLPRERYSIDYELEYGNATIEVHKSAIQKGQRILIHDDLLATGGTAEAAGQLIQMAGAHVMGYNFLCELEFLNGRKRLEKISPQIFTFADF